VRLDLLPLLERFNPAVRTALVRTAETAADDVAALDELVVAVHRELARPAAPDVLAYDLAGLRRQPRALQRRLLRHGLGCLLGTLEDVHVGAIEDALVVVRSAQPGQAYHLPYGVELVIGENIVEMRRFGAARRRSSNIWGSAAPRV